MTNKLAFNHRQLPDNWNRNSHSITSYLQVPIDSAATLAQDVLDTLTNLSIADPPTGDTVDNLIYKTKIIRDYLLDASEMIDAA